MTQHLTIFQVQQLELNKEEIWLAEMADRDANQSRRTEQSEQLELKHFKFESRPAAEPQQSEFESRQAAEEERSLLPPSQKEENEVMQ